MLPEQLQQAIKNLPSDSQLVIQAVVVFYESQVQALKSRIGELEDQLSKNRSKLPSTDEFVKPSPKSLRKQTGRKAGGQKGHEGNTLKMVDRPDEEVLHKVEVCACCQKSLREQKADAIERRQVYDLPPLALIITEHQTEIKRCSCGHINRQPSLGAGFPIGVSHYVQYGSNIKSLLLYMQDYQLLPYGRSKEFVQDVFGHSLSTGTLYNIGQYAFEQLRNQALYLISSVRTM